MKKVLLFLTLGLFLTTAAVASSPLSGNNLVSAEIKLGALTSTFGDLSTDKVVEPLLGVLGNQNVDCGFPVYYQDDYVYGYGYLDCNGYTGSNIDFWNWFLSLFF